MLVKVPLDIEAKQRDLLTLDELRGEAAIATKRSHLLTLDKLRDAAADTSSFLILESYPKFAAVEDVNKLKSAINKRAWALELKTTRCIYSNGSVKGKYRGMELINHGEGVTFYNKGDPDPVLQCGGLMKTADGAVHFNEVKASPTEKDIQDVQKRVKPLNGILELFKLHFHHVRAYYLSG
jgi:hypothetical protein